jgi:hypothetical protein
MQPLFDLIVRHVAPPQVEQGPFRMIGTILEANNFLGRIITGRISSGSIKPNQAVKVLGADGAVGNRVLASIAPPSGNPREAGSLRAAAWFTARHYLASHAIVTTQDYDVTADDVRGVVWGTSMTSALSNAAGVRDPMLLMAMTAHYALRPAEMILDAAASSDKELVGVEGATHALTPCGVCTEPAAAYGDTLRRTMEYVDRWLLKRF